MNIFNYKNKKINKTLKAFTLMELMVSTTIFTIAAVGGLSVLLASDRAYKRVSSNRVAADNVSMVTDTVSRELKFGSSYSCVNANGNFASSSNYQILPSTSSEVFPCNAVSFFPQGYITKKIVYYFNSGSKSINEVTYIKNGDDNFAFNSDIPITSTDFEVINLSFQITGNSVDDFLQPKIRFFISGIIFTSKNTLGENIATSTISVQGVVSQRVLDD